MTRHYYKLAGESLNALNRLIEFDSMRSDEDMAGFRERMKDLLPKSASDAQSAKEKEKAEQRKILKAHFTDAQVRAYQEMLGFTQPAISVRDYGDGIVRAYHVMPQIAMNPGTSKRAFGFINILKEAGAVGDTPQVEEGRTAFYASPEDYTGSHFVPPGAVPVTAEELETYNPIEDLFEYYETYNEGIPAPANLDPAVHRIIDGSGSHLVSDFNHFFLLGGDMLSRMLAWREQDWPWTDAYQQFRDKFYDAVRTALPDVANHMTVWIEDADGPNGQRCLVLSLPSKILEDNWAALEPHFDILKVEKSSWRTGEVQVYATPTLDTALGIKTATDLALVPIRLPGPPPFLQVPSLSDRHPVYEADVTGFPDYYRIERYEDGAVKLLVIDLPQIKSIDMPDGFTAVSPDDYAALSGSQKKPTHILRIGGATYDALDAYDTYNRRQRAEEAAFWQLFESLLVKPREDDAIEKPYIGHYADATRHKSLMFDVSERLYRANVDLFNDCFTISYRMDPMQEDQRHAFYFDTIRTDTATGKMLSDALAAISPHMNFPEELVKQFGFDRNGGYGFMDVKPMSGLDQYAVLWSLPPFITAVHTPPDCVALTRREYATLVLDSADISGGSVPPPRPADLTHLPMPGGQKSYEHISNLKKSKDKDGLPLHEKTVFGWFKTRRKS